MTRPGIREVDLAQPTEQETHERTIVGAPCRGPAVTTARPTRWGIIVRMWGWFWIIALYLLSVGLLRWLGGIGAAADAIQSWGHAVAERRRRGISSSADTVPGSP